MSEQEGAGLSNEQSIPNLREALDKANADRNELQEQFNQVSGELKNLKAKEAFKASGFQDSHAELFLKANPDAEINNESISEFVNTYNLSPAKQESVPSPQTNEGLANLGNVGNNANPAVVGTAENAKMTKAEYKKLQATDPTAAHQALVTGRVQMRDDNIVANQTFNK
jgi:hypothetical protein